MENNHGGEGEVKAHHEHHESQAKDVDQNLLMGVFAYLGPLIIVSYLNSKNKLSKKKGLTFNEKKEFETLESTIAQKDELIVSINAQLAQTPPEQFKKIEEISLLHAKTEQELQYAMLRWMELSEKLSSN